MLKNTISTNDNLDISIYKNLNHFLKKQSSGYICQKQKVLTANEMTKFLKEAPDDQYLAMKVNMMKYTDLYFLNFY